MSIKIIKRSIENEKLEEIESKINTYLKNHNYQILDIEMEDKEIYFFFEEI